MIKHGSTCVTSPNPDWHEEEEVEPVAPVRTATQALYTVLQTKAGHSMWKGTTNIINFHLKSINTVSYALNTRYQTHPLSACHTSFLHEGSAQSNTDAQINHSYQ